MPPGSPTRSTQLGVVAIAAALAGVASTLLGVGGGIIMVPLLSIAGVPIKRAAANSLAVIAFVSVIGVSAQAIKTPDEIYWDAAAVLAATAFLGAYIGRRLHGVIPERAFRVLFAVLLVLSALRLAGLLEGVSAHMEYGLDAEHAFSIAVLLGIGLAAGVATSLFGVGGGIIVVPMLGIIFDRFTGEGFKAATNTSLAMIAPVSIFGAWLHYRAQNLDGSLIKLMAPIASITAICGVLLKDATSAASLKWLFAGLLIFAALQVAWQAFVTRSAAK